MKGLLGGTKEKVIGRVGHELGLTHSAGGSRNRSASGVQTLNESGVRQEVTAGGSLQVPDRLQQQALNRAGMRATRDLGAGIDPLHLDHPNPAAIERTLPRGVPTQRGRDTRFGVFVDALEVRDDLKLLPEEIRKEGGFGAGGWVPSCAASVRGEASITLAATGMSDQVRGVSCRHGNQLRSRWGGDLRCRMRDYPERTCEHKSGYKVAEKSGRFSGLLIEIVFHLLLVSNSSC